MNNKKEGYRRLSVIFTWIIGLLGMCWYVGLILYEYFDGTLNKILKSDFAVVFFILPLIIVFFLSTIPKAIYHMWLYAHEGFNKEVSE